MWTIREIDNGEKEAWDWWRRLPSFMREITDKWEEAEFKKSFLDGLNYGGFENRKLTAIVHGEVKNDYLVEGHLFCAPHASVELIQAAIAYGSREVLKTYSQIIIETPRRHKTLKAVLLNTGYLDTGLHSYRGKRMVETTYFIKL